MRLGSIVLVACTALATISAGAAFGTGLAHRDQVRAAQAVSTALPMSRRVDGSLDRYLSTRHAHTPWRRLTPAQRWIANSARPLVAHDSDPRVSLNIRGWEHAPPVSVYVNATGVNAYQSLRLREAAAWLVRHNGQRVQVDDWVMLDVRIPAARHWWLYGANGRADCPANTEQRGAVDLITCGYTGLWLDNLLTKPAQWFTPNPGIDDASWGAGLVALAHELRDALPGGVPFTVNAHWTDEDFAYAAAPQLQPESTLVQLSQIADQIVIEGGAIDRGLLYAAPATTSWSYRRKLLYADALHSGGATIQWEKTDSVNLTARDARRLGRTANCRDADYRPRNGPVWTRGSTTWKAHVRTAAFNTATALLTFEPGDSVGDICEYPGRSWRGYGVDLGPPVAARNDTGTAITRLFSGGFVAVNPGNKRLRITLPDGRGGINLASTAKVDDTRVQSSFKLAPRTALVVQYAG
jgi:hypothetical protein